jgi:hypothetical protein
MITVVAFIAGLILGITLPFLVLSLAIACIRDYKSVEETQKQRLATIAGRSTNENSSEESSPTSDETYH